MAIALSEVAQRSELRLKGEAAFLPVGGDPPVESGWDSVSLVLHEVLQSRCGHRCTAFRVRNKNILSLGIAFT